MLLASAFSGVAQSFLFQSKFWQKNRRLRALGQNQNLQEAWAVNDAIREKAEAK